MENVRGITTLPALYNAYPDGDIIPISSNSTTASPAPPSAATSSTHASLRTIPLLIGSNAREMSDFARFIGKNLLGRWFGGGLMSFLVRNRFMLAPEPMLRLVAGRQSKDEIPNTTARSCCDVLVAANDGSVAAVVDLLATHPERTMAATHSGDVYEFDIHLSADESPIVGSGHGADLALLFMPERATPGCSNAGDDGPGSEAMYKRACNAFWGRDSMRPDVELVGEGLKDAVVRFAKTGRPGHFNGVDWPTNGEMVVTTDTPAVPAATAGHAVGAPTFESQCVCNQETPSSELLEDTDGLRRPPLDDGGGAGAKQPNQ